MRQLDGLITLGIVLVILLAVTVAYLLIQQRSFQRIDYSRQMDEDDLKRRTEERLARLDDLYLRLSALEGDIRAQFHELTIEARRGLEERIAGAREEIIRDILDRPGEYDRLVAKGNRIGAGPIEARPDEAGQKAEDNPHLVRFLAGPRQRQIAELLELGHQAAEVSEMLGVSKHEIELVAAIIFSEETA